MEEKFDGEEIIKIMQGLRKFMDQTNDMLEFLDMQIKNIKVDIDKLKKKTNTNKIII